MADNVFGTLAEMMIVSQYTGILLVIGLIILGSLIFWRGGWVRTRLIIGLLFLIGAGVLYFGYAATLG
jgi:hypothetical protein